MNNRPALMNMLKSITKERVQDVYVYKIDRLSRKLLDALNIVEALEKEEVKLFSLKEQIDLTSPLGKMVFQVMGSFAELERNTIVDRVKSGMTQRAKKGGFNGGIVLGYNSINKQLVINPKEAKIVEEIFTLAKKGHGYKRIANEINGKGYRTKKGNLFAICTIKGILDNPIYIGKICFNQLVDVSSKKRKGKNQSYILAEGTHSPIISEELWNVVQYARRTKVKPAKGDYVYLLTGLLRCPNCHTGMVAHTNKGHKEGVIYRRYECGNYHNKGRAACRSHSLESVETHKVVLKELSIFF